MEGTTLIEEGKIKCKLYGEMTGIDCQCLQETPCRGCFIFDSINDYEFRVAEKTEELN